MPGKTRLMSSLNIRAPISCALRVRVVLPALDRPEKRNALNAALAFHACMPELRERLAPAGAELQIGVGVNTGEMIVGNMGAEERFDYTVVGDPVNVSSRLEGLSKAYGVF